MKKVIPVLLLYPKMFVTTTYKCYGRNLVHKRVEKEGVSGSISRNRDAIFVGTGTTQLIVYWTSTGRGGPLELSIHCRTH